MEVADVCIIGGGIVGCSVFFELERLGFSCVLLEKNDNLMSEASSGNSGMLHTGFDAPSGSVELQCIQRCLRRIEATMDGLRVPYRRNGAVMVAWDQQQALKLEEVRTSSLNKGIHQVFPLPLSHLYRQEPYLRSGAEAALWIPGESVLEPSVYGLLLAHHGRRHGNKVMTGCEVQGYEMTGADHCSLRTTLGPVVAKAIINCAGLHGDRVQNLAGINTFSIKPRKGQYTVYGKNSGHLISSSILPVPTEKTKGVIAFRTVHNNVIVGPTAEDVQSRHRPAIDPVITARLQRVGRQLLPDLTHCSPLGHYTGVRPATEFKDYQICTYPDRQWITVGGIRSTGVSGSLGIAELVGDLLQDDLHTEPSRGASRTLEAADWNLLPSGHVSADGQMYGVCHPITLFGLKGEGGSSKM